MSALLTQDHLAAVNAAVRDFKEAKSFLKEAESLVAITDKQTIMVGKPDGVRGFYRVSIDLPQDAVQRILRDRVAAAKARFAACGRKLAQLNVETPA